MSQTHLNPREITTGASQPLEYAHPAAIASTEHAAGLRHWIKPATWSTAACARLRPLVAWLAAHGVTATDVSRVVTLFSVSVSALLAALPANLYAFTVMALWLLLRMGLKAIKRMLEREHPQASVSAPGHSDSAPARSKAPVQSRAFDRAVPPAGQ